MVKAGEIEFEVEMFKSVDDVIARMGSMLKSPSGGRVAFEYDRIVRQIGRYNALVADNSHTEAFIALAEMLGNKKYRAALGGILQIEAAYGYLPHQAESLRVEISRTLQKMAEKKMVVTPNGKRSLSEILREER